MNSMQLNNKNVIESKYRHDFKFCKCGAVAVDGGKAYLRRLGYEEDYEELSEVEKEDKKDDLLSEVNYLLDY